MKVEACNAIYKSEVHSLPHSALLRNNSHVLGKQPASVDRPQFCVNGASNAVTHLYAETSGLSVLGGPINEPTG